jgi:co-chaperonin GroES (HSP10)
MNDKRRFTQDGERTTVAEAPEETKFEIEPLQQWVLIRKVQREETMKGDVILPGGGRSSRGIVVAASKEVPLEVGEMVIFTNFPIEIEDIEELTGDRDLKLVRYEEVYARVRQCT